MKRLVPATLLNAFYDVMQRCAASQTLAQLPGIGPITASALVASIGNAKNFKNGRQLAAWLGLVPRQHSSGGKSSRTQGVVLGKLVGRGDGTAQP